MNWNFGFRLGLSPYYDNKLYLPYEFGLFVNFSHILFSRVQIEANYSTYYIFSNDFKLGFDCVSFPILIRMQTRLGLFFNAGFSIFYLFNGNVLEKYTINTIDIENDFDKTGLKVHLAIGWKLNIIKNYSLLFESRLNYDLFSLTFKTNTKNISFSIFTGFEY